MQRLRVGIAAGQTLFFVAISAAVAFKGTWLVLVVLLPAAAISAFQTWLRYSTQQPVTFVAAAVIAINGRDAIPPKNERPRQ
jgi:hypothetical protein